MARSFNCTYTFYITVITSECRKQKSMNSFSTLLINYGGLTLIDTIGMALINFILISILELNYKIHIQSKKFI